MLLHISGLKAQKTDNFYIAPAFHVGYAFFGGWSLGVDVDMGLWQKMNDEGDPINTGFSIGKYWYQTYHDTFDRITTFNYMRETEHNDAKFGFAYIVDPHGFNNIVRCRKIGLNIDLAATSEQAYIPYAGLKTVLYNWSNWYGFNSPYMSLYVKYKYDIMQTSGIKTTE